MSKKNPRRKMRKESVTTGSVPPVMASSPSKSYEFKPDYSYVIRDLRRIGVLAGTFIAVLLVLSFFLR